jgi:hypothetical protein
MLRPQCWLFAIGSSLFAIGTAPGFAMVGGAGATNLLCFISQQPPSAGRSLQRERVRTMSLDGVYAAFC